MPHLNRPLNLLVVTCDQLRYDALGCTGSPVARTPNLDRLAAQSVFFDRCFTQCPSCAPARHTMATGRYPHAHGLTVGSRSPTPGLSQIAHALEPLGYRHIDIGRCHWNDPLIGSGYDVSVESKNWMSEMPTEVCERYAWEWQDTTRQTTGGPSTRTVEQHRGAYVSRHAIAQIEEAVLDHQPFFCWVDVTEPHPPFYPPREFYEAIDQEAIQLPAQAAALPPHPEIVARQRQWSHLTETEIRQMTAAYHGLVSLADQYCGRLFDALEHLGVRQKTIILWTADHGDQMWEHRLFLKKCMFEGSVHVPLVVSVPGMPTLRRSELVEHVDLFPTICELLGATCPKSVQGRSLVPLLHAGSAPLEWRNAVFADLEDLKMIRTERWKLNVRNGRPSELFDLCNDPGEFVNLLEKPSHLEITTQLQEKLRVWAERTSGPNESL